MADLSPEQLIALSALKKLIGDAAGRRAYASASPAEKADVFNESLDQPHADADYGALPDQAREILEGLSDSELALLSDIDAAFVAGGLRFDSPDVEGGEAGMVL